jgi:hypothetical protein
VLGPVELAVRPRARRRRQCERRGCAHVRRAEARQPSIDQLAAGSGQVRGHVVEQQVAGRACVARLGSVDDGGLDVAVGGQPAAGPGVGLARCRRVLDDEAGAQRVGQEAVVPVRAARAVEGDQEAGPPREVLEDLRRVRAVEHRVAQRPGQAVQDRRAPEEGLLAGREGGEDLVAHELPGNAVLAREPRQRGEGIGLGDRPARREVHHGRPPLGPPHEPCDDVARRLDAGETHQRHGLRPGQCEILAGQLDHAPVRAQAAEPDGRLAARQQRQPGARGNPVGQVTQSVQRLAGRVVEVVDDERPWLP